MLMLLACFHEGVKYLGLNLQMELLYDHHECGVACGERFIHIVELGIVNPLKGMII